MKAPTRILGLAVAGALLFAGTVAAPAQAAPPTKPVTKGYGQLGFNVPGLPSGSFVAEDPARTTAEGLVFPISSVVAGTRTRINLSGALAFDGVSTGVSVPIYAMLNNATKEIEIAVSPPASAPIVFFFSSGMSVSGPKTKVNKAKKIRTTTTTWTGDLRVVQDGPQVSIADELNRIYGTTSFTPGGKVGRLTLHTSVTAPCKNAACTK